MPQALDDNIKETIVQAAVIAKAPHKAQPLQVLMETHALPDNTASPHALPLIS